MPVPAAQFARHFSGAGVQGDACVEDDRFLFNNEWWCVEREWRICAGAEDEVT